MEIILTEMGLPPDGYRTDERLVEAAYGDFEGVTIDEMECNHPAIFADRKANRWHFTPTNGESLQMAMERVSPLLDELIRPTVIVAHGAVGRTVRKHLLGLNENEAGWYTFPQDKVFVFEDGEERLA